MNIHRKSPLILISNHANAAQIHTSVIWLHGLGADGYDFEPVVNQLFQSEYFTDIRFILPHAPDMAVTRNQGYIMPAWYDVYGVIPISKEDELGIAQSQQYINTLIQHEVELGIAPERIILAGFSQGGAIALHTALRYPQPLAGVLALSTYLPLHATLRTEASEANKNIPIFMAHGVSDDIINLEMARRSRDALLSAQYRVDWREYPMAHSLCMQEIVDIEGFFKQVLP